MFLGHYGVAFALKRAEPKVSLGTLFIAVQLVDLAWCVTILLGWEQARIVPGYAAASPFEFLNVPITHSLLAGVVWGIAAAALYYSWPTTDTARHWQASAFVGLAVLSHWFLDVVVHVPDLPIASNDGLKVGLGLWRSLPATLAVELGVFGIGLALHLSQHSRRHPVPRLRVAIVAAALVTVFLTSMFGPLPGSMRLVAWSGIVCFLAAGLLGAWANSRAIAPSHP